MKKDYLFLLVLLYISMGVSVKATEVRSEGSLVNKNSESVFCIAASKDSCEESQIEAEGRTPLTTLVDRLYIWRRNLTTESESSVVEQLKKIVRSNPSTEISEIDFPVKPHCLFERPPGFDKTIHIKLKGSRLEPQLGNRGHTKHGDSLENNIDQDEIEKYTSIFLPEKNEWVRGSDISVRRSSRSRSLWKRSSTSSSSRSAVGQEMSEDQIIEADTFNFQFKNEGKSPLFILVTNGEETEAEVLVPGQSFERARYGGESFTHLFMWVKNADEVGIERQEVIDIVKAGMDEYGEDMTKTDFREHDPDYFIPLFRGKLWLLQWKNDELSPQETKGGGSLSNNVTKKDLLKNLLVRIEKEEGETEWVPSLVSKLHEIAFN